MTLKKTIAGYFKDYEVDVYKDVPVNQANGLITETVKVFSHKEKRRDWIEQRDVDMHPLEEKEMLAHWAIHDQKIKIPSMPTKEEEHEWLIEHGAEYVKQRRDEWQAKHDEFMPDVIKAQDYFQECHKAWCDHIEMCCANGLDPNTHEIEKYK